MKFIWDENKRQSNIKKHGLDFIDAPQVLAHTVVYRLDDRYSEERWRVYGKLKNESVLLVVTETELPEEVVVRIISMRLATTNEKTQFENKLLNYSDNYDGFSKLLKLTEKTPKHKYKKREQAHDK